MTEKNDFDFDEDDLIDLMEELKALAESDLSTPSQIEEAEEVLKEIKDHLDEPKSNGRSQ